MSRTVTINWIRMAGWLLLLSASQGDDQHPGHETSSTSSSHPSDDDMSSIPANCTAREAKRNYRYQSIRNDILRKLRLDTPPNVTSHRLPAIPQLQSIIDEMCRQRGASCAGALGGDRGGAATDDRTPADSHDDDDILATTIKILLFPTSPDRRSAASVVDRRQTCRFSFQSDIVNNDIVSATFGVYIRRATHAAHRPYMATWVLVYALWEVAPDRPPERHLVHRRRIYLDHRDTGRWHRFSFLAQVRRWIANPHSNHGLLIQATDSRGEPLAVIQPLSDAELPYKPYLELIVSGSQQATRSKRTTDLDCNDQSSERRCCRYPLVVDFDAFGWHWVIVPRRYSAYYCSGECPFLYMQTHGPGTHVRQQQQQQQRETAVRPAPDANGGPCCSPRRVSSISMLYYDDYMNIVYGRLPKMVVEQCGCA